MSEHLKEARRLIRANRTNPSGGALMDIVESLYCHLKAQQETPASGLTSHESAGASPEIGTTSTPATGTTGPTSSRLGPGRAWEESGSLLTRNLPSRTTEPTSSTPSTDRSTGLSASTGSHKEDCGATRGWEAGYLGDLIWVQCRECKNVAYTPNPFLAPASSPEPAQEGNEDRCCYVCGWPESHHLPRRSWSHKYIPPRTMKEGSERG